MFFSLLFACPGLPIRREWLQTLVVANSWPPGVAGAEQQTRAVPSRAGENKCLIASEGDPNLRED